MTNELKPDDPLLTSADVRSLCGKITQMTLWRWREFKGFPEPLTINTRNYWQLSDVREWLKQFNK
jgi:predicted DNA-binding transcriptional regulator AlpA